MSFERALLHIFQVEGGFVNRSGDKGGATNFGITAATLAAFRKTPVTVDDVRALTAVEAGDIYRQEYWNANALFFVDNPRFQTLLFDQVVARGGYATVTILQRVLNKHCNAGLVLDGIMGSVTARALNLADEVLIGIAFIREVQKAYVHQGLSAPSQLQFLEGWLNRTFTLFDFII